MDNELKKRIIKRYLEQISTPETNIPIETIEDLPIFLEFGNALDALEISYNSLLEFQNVELQQAKWERLSAVLEKGLTFTPGAPSVITRVEPQKMKNHAQYIKDNLDLDRLPQPDYHRRTTAPHEDTQTTTIDPLIIAARGKLGGFLRDITKPRFNPDNIQHVEQIIKELQESIKNAAKTNNQERIDHFTKYLTVAEDLLKVNKLSAMAIPNEAGGDDIYCSLAEAAGGVTEKVSLVSLNTVTTQLGRLRDTDFASVDEYLDNRRDFKLSTEAILKLPKHGNIKEVQREAMALNISRILGLDTTGSCIMTHGGKPALFVPFDAIKLMKEFATGKTFTAFGSSKTYEHYSTINPVGSGLQGDQYIDDFGNSMGLFYVCSDTDSIGGYNQNKALRNDRSLFIFDQVVMSSDKMKLDSRLSLQPDALIMKHTRHGQGRNRTLIEDSSLTSKFDSFVHLITKKNQIYKYAERTARIHQREVERLEAALRPLDLPAEDRRALTAQKKQAEVLRDDAIEIRDAIKRRIDKIYELMPARKSPGLTNDHTRQALVLEKLLHNPMLFTDDGRPYKYPWTYRHKNPVKSMQILENGNMLLTFDSKVPAPMIDFIKRHGGGDSIRLRSAKEIEISPHDLLALRETMLHPETRLEMQHGVNYLDRRDLEQVGAAYGKGHRGRILNLVSEYTSIMTQERYSQEDKLKAIRNVSILLQRYIDTADDKGFGKHVMKKIHFDIQQRLQAMIPLERRPDNLDEAFAAALKLDRVELFNKVITQAIKQNQLELPAFRVFLQSCIDQAEGATNHPEAVTASRTIKDSAEQLLETFNAPVPIIVQDIFLDDVDPQAIREAELDAEVDLHVAVIVPPVDPQLAEQRTLEDEARLEQTVTVGAGLK